ncbi:hypothetical protein [Streptomyces sp. SP17KL33]|uniref:hypothetical protein n=1 Tax=Streptomyces sp. SP17KL33 TaxID=3002534 RepID=UPI002E7A8B0E|nr:hypothetical protein [Streptomyces sp. SP17KL33]
MPKGRLRTRGASNATDLVAQVGASAAAGADTNRMPATADTDAALQGISEVSPQGATG